VGGVSTFPKKYLPADAFERCSGRIGVALTRTWPNPSLEAEFVTSFTSKEDLIEAVMASGCVEGCTSESDCAHFPHRDIFPTLYSTERGKTNWQVMFLVNRKSCLMLAYPLVFLGIIIKIFNLIVMFFV
jgi:hypothetical protein